MAETGNRERQPHRDHLRWVLATLPLAPLALFLYVGFEWLFFISKPSFLAVLGWGERLAVLLQTPQPFLRLIIGAQVLATILSLASPRVRSLALVPAAGLLGALILVLADNFLYAIAGSSLKSSEVLTRLVYGGTFAGGFLLFLRKLSFDVPRVSTKNRALILLWLMSGTLIAGSVLSGLREEAAPPSPLRVRVRSNVLLLSIDGVDAERLSAYGYELPTSPFLESLRGETLFCENAFSNAGQTYTSQTSFLTGKLPFTTKVIVPPAVLRGDASREHLPALFRSAGYRSLQLSMRHFGDAEESNLSGGFELTNYRWENPLSIDAVEARHDLARPFRLAVIDRLDARLARILATRPVADEFAHVMGASASPLWADSRRLSAFVEFIEAAPGPWFVHLHLHDTHAGHHHRAGVQRVGTNRYDNLLRNADDHVRMVFDALTQRRLLDRTIIVITTDHSSDKSVGTRLRIPLMIRFPGGAHARREKRNVQLIDVAPTLLDALGAHPRSWMEGTSLLRPAALTEQRVIYATGAVGPSRDLGPLSIDVPRPPHHGLRTIHAMSGSTWYALELATGKTAMGPVAGHTEPLEPAPMSEVLGGAREMLVHNGWQELPRLSAPRR